jgi:protein-S-isoprenylcysteine O-methyltransferase Ste14
MFRLILALTLAVFVVHRGYYSRKLPPDPETTVRQQQAGVATRVASLLGIAALLSTLVYCLAPEWMAWASLPLPSWLRWAGVGLALGGFTLLQWSQETLGRNWSDTPRLIAQQTLVTDGPYRWIRHPIYTAFLLILSAPLLLAANWFVGGAWLGMTAIDVWVRVRFEEAMLLQAFGEEYRAYMESSGRLLPRR